MAQARPTWHLLPQLITVIKDLTGPAVLPCCSKCPDIRHACARQPALASDSGSPVCLGCILAGKHVPARGLRHDRLGARVHLLPAQRAPGQAGQAAAGASRLTLRVTCCLRVVRRACVRCGAGWCEPLLCLSLHRRWTRVALAELRWRWCWLAASQLTSPVIAQEVDAFGAGRVALVLVLVSCEPARLVCCCAGGGRVWRWQGCSEVLVSCEPAYLACRCAGGGRLWRRQGCSGRPGGALPVRGCLMQPCLPRLSLRRRWTPLAPAGLRWATWRSASRTWRPASARRCACTRPATSACGPWPMHLDARPRRGEQVVGYEEGVARCS